MLIPLLILTGLSAAALIGGSVWTVVAYGETRRRTGADVGAEFLADSMADDIDGPPVAQATLFKGKAVQVQGEATVSFAEIKQSIRTGQWRRLLPILLAIAGFLGIFLFGSLAAWVGFESKLVAGLFVAAVSYAFVRTVLAFAKA
jgi:hypothetical protein